MSMMSVVKKIDWKALIISLLVSFGVAGLSAFLTNKNMDIYKDLVQPPLAPPGIVFPIVWTILFTLMGISAYMVYKSGGEKIGSALALYGVQLVFNFFWSIIFFNIRNYLFAFIWLIILIGLIAAMIIRFYDINKTAGLLQIPYLLWVLFAGYLNLAIFLLN